MDKFLYRNHPVLCVIPGPSECGKPVFLTNLILKIIIEYDKTYIYSASLHQVYIENYLNVSLIIYHFT